MKLLVNSLISYYVGCSIKYLKTGIVSLKRFKEFVFISSSTYLRGPLRPLLHLITCFLKSILHFQIFIFNFPMYLFQNQQFAYNVFLLTPKFNIIKKIQTKYRLDSTERFLTLSHLKTFQRKGLNFLLQYQICSLIIISKKSFLHFFTLFKYVFSSATFLLNLMNIFEQKYQIFTNDFNEC